jgi:hypothetical protein
MGMILRAIGNTIPYNITLDLDCDGRHGLLDAPHATFDATHGHPRDPAVKAGWKITADGPVLCPDCGQRYTNKEPNK